MELRSQLLCPQISPGLQSALESQSPSPLLHGMEGVQQSSSPLQPEFILKCTLDYFNIHYYEIKPPPQHWSIK